MQSMEEKISQALQLAVNGSHKLKITFEKEATGGVNYLIDLHYNEIVWLNESDRMALMVVAQFHHWGDDSCRTIVVTLTNKFIWGRLASPRLRNGLEGWFLSPHMCRILENIEVVK